MPVAGDEGYEEMVVCPYDKAHEVRKGRMQFHLKKCRENHSETANKVQSCCFNRNHTVPVMEMNYHLEYECDNRKDWLRNRVQLDSTKCPVGDLVPVNAGIVPEGEESWDNIESTGSILDKIKTEAAEKPILRLMQCESKAKRKTFRAEEKLRHLQWDPTCQPNSSCSSVQGDEPAEVPKFAPKIPVKRQELSAASNTVNRVFNAQERTPGGGARGRDNYPELAPSAIPSTSAWSASRPGSVSSNSVSVNQAWPALGRSASAASVASTSSAPAPATGSIRRPTIAMNIAASASRVNPPEQVFSTVPIPGRGRGRRIPPQ